MSSSKAQQLLSRLIPPARKQLEQLEAYRRRVVWGDTQLTLRVREYPKSKDERVSLVKPQWQKVRLYSEVLRRKVPLVMTTSTLRMIEEGGGLDTYLVSTPESKLKSDTASAVKWEVITALRAHEHRGQLAQARVSAPVQAAAGAAGTRASGA